MGMYLKNGFINIEWAADLAARHNIAFVFIVGKRQIGKTYGVLQYLLKNEKPFIYLRRTSTEIDFVTKDINNPFNKIPDARTHFEKNDKYTYIIKREAEGNADELFDIGMATSLTAIAKIRGFDGSRYIDMIYDECIPENHVFKIKDEGDAFLNAYVTISGNRELEGKPPFRVWLLANSNNFNAPIISALNVSEELETMYNKNIEFLLLKDRGMTLFCPDSNIITEKRKETALYKAIGTNSKFAKMSIGGEWAYNDMSDVRNMSTSHFKPSVNIGELTIHVGRDSYMLYVTEKIDGKVKIEYPDTDYFKQRFRRDLPDIRSMWLSGKVTFQSLTVKQRFIDFIEN